MMREKSKKSKKGIYGGIILGGVIIVSAVIILIYFPRLFNHRNLISLSYYKEADKEYIFRLSQEISYNKNYPDMLDGYLIEVIEPTTGDILGDIYLERSSENFSYTPKLTIMDLNNIWLVLPKQNIAGDTGYIANVSLENNKFNTIPTSYLNGYSVSGIYDGKVGLLNKYNEPCCLGLKEKRVNTKSCEYDMSYLDKGVTGFLFVKPQESSTRTHVYYYRNDDFKRNTEITITSGLVERSTSIAESIALDRGYITEEELLLIDRGNDTEELKSVYVSDYLISPIILMENQNVAVIATSDSKGDVDEVFLFGRNGKMFWRIKLPQVFNSGYMGLVQCTYTEKQTIINFSTECVIAIDNKTGKILWEFPRD